MPDNEVPSDEKPPYLSLTTLLNFLDKWADGPIPPRVDKSALESYSGGTQAALLSTLRLMGYIDSEGLALPALRQSVQSEAARQAHLQGWARQFYREQLALAEQNDTAGKLHESFARHGYSGSTLRKAVVFYLALTDHLGLPKSTLFRAPKQSGTPTSRRRPAGTATTRPTPAERAVVPPTPPPSRGETSTVTIGDLATITIVVDAQWMKLPVETITAMRGAIDALEALGAQEQP